MDSTMDGGETETTAMLRRQLALLLIGGYSLAGWFVFAQEPGNANPATSSAASGSIASQTSDHKMIGSMSCASSACHGSTQPDLAVGSIRRDEYIFWLERDPHAKAFEVLSNERSMRMFEALGVMRDGKPVNGKGAEYGRVFQRCAACHATPQPPPGEQGAGGLAQREGVGCEMCHGPASDWLAKHYRRGFPDKLDADRVSKGMNLTARLDHRAAMCAKCHVGGPGQDVDHDLIAAGHPMLKFELAAYQAMLPKHWKDSRDRANYANRTDWELQLWLQGQVKTSLASVAQLKRRAMAAASDQKGAVWPELSESNCYACHHDLAPAESWRQQGYARRKGGKLSLSPWSDWNPWMVSTLFEQLSPEAMKPLSDLRDAMDRSLVPESSEIGKLAAAAEESLDRWWETQVSDDGASKLSGDWLEGAVLAIAGRDDAIDNWDRAAQVYLALQAIAESRASADAGEMKPTLDALREMRDLLAFRRGDDQKRYDSPKRFTGKLEEAVEKSKREAFHQLLLKVVKLLETR